MITILSYSPGQKATLFLETLNASGIRTNSATTPSLTRVILPSGVIPTDGYPAALTSRGTGLYSISFLLQTGAAAVGSYLAEVTYTSPVTSQISIATYQLLVSPTAGMFSAAP